MQRRTALHAAAAVATGTALAACGSPPTASTAPSTASSTTAADADFDTWAEAFCTDWVRLSPERATFMQYFSGAEQAALDGQLSPITDAQRDRQLALARDGLARLARWLPATGSLGAVPARLGPSQRVDAALLRWSLQNEVDGAPFSDHYFVFTQTFGLHLRQVNLLSENQPLRRASDLPALLSRLRAAPAQLDQGLQRAQRAASRGFVPPRFIVERVRGQVVDLLQAAPADHVIVTSLATRSARLADLPAATRQAALDEARRVVDEGLRPAWQRLLALLDDLLPKAGDAAGFSSLPDGRRAYAHALAANTTTTLDAEQVHAIGLREVARIEAEMDRVLRTLGYSDGTVNQRTEALNLKLQPPAEPDPRPGLLARYAEYTRDAQRRAQPLFKLQPTAPVEVRRVPALTERTASAYYTTPVPDGSRPGVFWAPLPGPRFNVLRMRSLVVHEAVPGHHFQLALQQEARGLPRWRRQRVFGGGSAFVEGWALYAERLALDQGWYADDAPSLVGALDAQLFRARRLVVDTGLHVRGWTRQQAIDYGLPAHEVERYVVNPGQACAYMIGMLQILAFRDEAQKTLGARFSLPEFHDVVLRTGSVPLDVLGEVVRDWAARA